MNQPKVEPEGYIQLLIASPRQFTCTEAARVQPASDPTAHDAFARRLTRLEPDPEALWQEACTQIRPDAGVWVLDDSTLDKPYAHKIELVYPHWSGKHNQVVDGINLLTLLWTDGDRHVPCDWAVYDKPNDGLNKNALFRTLLRRLLDRGQTLRCVCFDSWYSGLDNLKLLRSFGWRWLTRLKSNRSVRLERGRSAITSALRFGRVCVWKPGATTIGPPGSRPKGTSSEMPFAPTSPTRNTYSSSGRNSYRVIRGSIFSAPRTSRPRGTTGAAGRRSGP